MPTIKTYLDDGACAQARAVLAMLSHFTIESSWNPTTHRYDAEINVGRWENCREQGYILSLVAPWSKQLNIAFFEHRNSDSICAIKWEQFSMTSITIDTAVFGDVYKTKWDVSHTVDYGHIVEMVEWIRTQFTEFWEQFD